MFENIKALRIIIMLLFVYSSATTVFLSTSHSSSSREQITQLNAQIAQQNVLINTLQKDNDDLKAIREMMEKDRAEKEAAQRRHEEGAIGFATSNPFHGDFSRNVFDALEGKPHKSGDNKR